jgi:hypothetical protein
MKKDDVDVTNAPYLKRLVLQNVVLHSVVSIMTYEAMWMSHSPQSILCFGW